ncbi:hypothetical protein T07_13406 [Trichinella nelsoni]|uniref:Uncharacterized protein n=1 Tax=Trichinella nelsoni TaxID=6336 RepID=A0A0V0RTI0_9BILA|nr:hypothetical protein T07_13406 [Trichinella nelsoni]
MGCCLDGRVTCRRRQLFATAFVGFTSSSVGQALCACCLLAGLLLAVSSTNRENSDGRASNSRLRKSCKASRFD